MKRFSFMIVVMIATVSFALTWNFLQAGSCALGAAIGSYLGRELSVPTALLLSKLGVVDEDELFSPFSTLLYDVMDEGGVIGGIIGGVLVKYAFFEKPDLGKVALDLIFSYSISKIASQFFEGWINYYVIQPSSVGIYLGLEW